MRLSKWILCIAAAFVMGLSVGCDSDGGSTPTPAAGTYNGTWQGSACGGTRGFTMVLLQSGTNLSGTFTMTRPDVSGPIDGSVTDQTPPAPAVLNSTLKRSFQLTFGSFASMNGTYYKDGALTCDVKAAK